MCDWGLDCSLGGAANQLNHHHHHRRHLLHLFVWWFLVSRVFKALEVVQRIVVGHRSLSVHPGDGDPLRGGLHFLNGRLQVADGIVNVVVDNCQIKVVSVR